MELLRDILAWALILTGCFFTVVSAFGLVRLPDVYTRIHSAGLVDTVGAGFLLIGLMLYGGFTIVTIKLFLILAFIFFTSPTANNAFANAVYSAGIKPLLAKDDSAKDPGKDGAKKEGGPSST
jgi:multicomponent Na+:H+ antiporter subunit G